jgi:hypothetical protein
MTPPTPPLTPELIEAATTALVSAYLWLEVQRLGDKHDKLADVLNNQSK